MATATRCTVSILVFCLSLLLSEARTRYHTLQVDTFRRNHQEELANCPTSLTGVQSQVRGSSPGEQEPNISLFHGICSRPVNSTWENLISQRLEQDNLRLNTILSRKNNSGDASTASDLDLPLKSGTQFDTGNYIVAVGFGTPSKDYLLTIDTGSDITWMQCKPCSTINSCYSQVDPIFDPQQSSSYKTLPCVSTECAKLTVSSTFKPCLLGTCVYEVRYGDGSRTEGDFSRETIKMGPDSFTNFAFGCGHTNTGLFKGSAGLLGLGRNSLALPAQTASKYGGQFSYCVPDFSATSSAGSLSFGRGSIPAAAVTTPLLSSIIYPSFYFVGLEAISVGGQRLPIPPSVFRTTITGGGTILDSGTIITRLVPQAYDALKTSFRKKASDLPSAKGFSILDTCYDLSKYKNVNIPTITFHYGNNANVDVSSVGILVPVKNDLTQVCLAFASTSQTDDVSIIGNFQQQRMRIAYDTAGRKIGFKAESCSA